MSSLTRRVLISKSLEAHRTEFDPGDRSATSEQATAVAPRLVVCRRSNNRGAVKVVSLGFQPEVLNATPLV
jgi:hypothetical protein